MLAQVPRMASAADPLWYKDAIIYELHVRAFYDSDGDGVGDFRGLTEKLDYQPSRRRKRSAPQFVSSCSSCPHGLGPPCVAPVPRLTGVRPRVLSDMSPIDYMESP